MEGNMYLGSRTGRVLPSVVSCSSCECFDKENFIVKILFSINYITITLIVNDDVFIVIIRNKTFVRFIETFTSHKMSLI